MDIDILYKDDYLLVVDKPEGLPIHMTQGMPHDADYLTKIIGKQLNCSVYNVHRLDAKTSGIVLLALSPEIAHELTLLFEQKKITKTYHAIVRENPGSGTFDNKVKNQGKRGSKNAVTHYKTLQTISTSICYKEFENISLSLVEVTPETGRWHQIRQHFAQGRFDIIGDNNHGDRMLNKIIAEKTGISRLLLHASSLQFEHPITKEVRTYTSELPVSFNQLLHSGLI
ncbi:pseudouridine synthase [Saccharicrinis sp. FJH2]|uniref:pseudouridine synthase n=1 Tax=Saccharicrinis sp. FJH65 TaxID=3344659 RepID=UPI0035F41F8A